MSESGPESKNAIVVHPVSRLGGKIVLGLYGALIALVLFRSLEMESGGDFLCMAVFMTLIFTPLPMLASMMGSRAVFYEDRIEVTGLLGKTTTLKLEDCTAVNCGSGRAYARSIVLRFGRRGKKVSISNMRRGFWDAAEQLNRLQEQYDWELKYGLLNVFQAHFWLEKDERGIKWI